jgi:hypothetical protein
VATPLQPVLGLSDDSSEDVEDCGRIDDEPLHCGPASAVRGLAWKWPRFATKAIGVPAVSAALLVCVVGSMRYVPIFETDVLHTQSCLAFVSR